MDTRLPLSSLPLRTRGRHIVTSLGSAVRLFCVNWYGAHLPQMVFTGLDVRPAEGIARTIVELGFNCVRLPYSLDLVYANSTVPEPQKRLAANPKLQGKTPLEVFDAVASTLTEAGLVVVLNNHISGSGWCCGFLDEEGLWYTEKYPETAWLESVSFMAARYQHDPRVVGFDLRNELRPSSQGVPTWGGGDVRTDWLIAARKASDLVLTANSNMLIVVSGLLYGMYLCDVPQHPLHLQSPELKGRVIYTAHEYLKTDVHQQVGGVLTTLAIVVVACHGFLWLCSAWARLLRRRLRPQAEICGHLLSSSTGEASGGSRCLCISVATGILCCALLGAACLFVHFVPRCGITRNMWMLSQIVAAACLPIMSLVLWASISIFEVIDVWCMYRRRADSSQLDVGIDLTLQTLPATHAGARQEQLSSEMTASEESSSSSRESCSYQASAVVSAACSRVCVAMLVSAAGAVACVVMWLHFGTYSAFREELDGRWGFLVTSSADAWEAPVWLGEFGTRFETDWWTYMLRYLAEREVSWAYWSVNGDDDHPYMALLLEDSQSIRQPWKLRDLQSLMNRTWTPPATVEGGRAFDIA
eukprot:TRINITY_DN29229_c0_g1_i1.p1 TRINITY_DN29229_c0_g1~~TRINITY_DN29229_c0_g1_i1.p1  ORF type:complete len:586 (-),score=104.94 TRINITY_DN29229_c0_g1_i1:39-1796(-)